MMPWFVWKGKNSLNDYGLWIKSLPGRVRPEERHEEVEIPGRAGSLLLLEGEDIYSPYTEEMVVIARDNINIDRVIEWLRGNGDLILWNDINKARSGRIVGRVAFDRVNNCWTEATVPFYFQPFRKNIYPESDRITVTGASGSIRNLGDVASKPVVSITGSGNNTITIGTQAMTFVMGSSPVTITVDCGAEMITSGNSIWSGTFSGDFWKIAKGSNAITQTGSARIVIDPNWRWL